MKSPLRNLPKSVKYLACYLPFIIVGTILIVVGVFQENSARIASIIVGIVVLISGLFAWCTDTDVGCLLICRYNNSSKQKRRQQQELSTESGQDETRTKTPTNTDSRGRSPDIEAAIHHTTTFTITNNRTTVINNRVDSPVNNNYEDGKLTDRLTQSRAITNNSLSRYGKFSLQQKSSGHIRRKRFGDDTLVKESRVGAFTMRNRNGDPIMGNENFGNNFGRGIRKNRKSRLTITNVTALNAGMINRGFHNSSEGGLQNTPYDPSYNMEFFMDRVKHNAISNWVTDVTSSMEDLTIHPDTLNPVVRQERQYKKPHLQREHRQPSVDTVNSTRTEPLGAHDELDEQEESSVDENHEYEETPEEEEETEIQIFHTDVEEPIEEDNGVELGSDDHNAVELGSDGQHEEYHIDEFMGSVSSNEEPQVFHQVNVADGGERYL